MSIDQVHEKMEWSYREIYQAVKKDVGTSLSYILHDFAAGMYAVSTNPFTYEGYQVAGDRGYHVHSRGIGVWQISDSYLIERPQQPVSEFEWQNDHYAATLLADGVVQMGEARLGYLVVSEEGERRGRGHLFG
ncbi:MAG: hypothetical protein GXP38_15390 [Chloroflexi bacterium]|nr:hypothetical protein [Chloroflexota bacterium]